MGGRRYSDGARRRPGRNSGSGGGPGGSVVFPQVPPLPASTLDYWHSELGLTPGASITAWTSQIKGITVTNNQINGPNYGVDTGFFNGRPVVQFVLSPPSVLYIGVGTTMFAAASRPYTFCVYRYRTASAGGQALYSFGTGATNEHMIVVDSNHTNTLSGNVNQDALPSSVDNGVVMGTTVHTEQFWVAGSTANLTVDNTNATGTPVTPTTVNATVTVALGQQTAGGRFSDTSMAFLLCCSAVPSAGEIAALRSWASGYWGAP